MDIVIGLTVLAIVGVAGTMFIFRTIDGRYPKVMIRYLEGRNMITAYYRQLGNAIVEDNLIGLLLGRFRFCGNASKLDYVYITQKGPLGFGNKLVKVYLASMRRGYLAHMKCNIDIANPVVFRGKYEGKDATVEISKNGIMIPLDIVYTNDELKETEISNGKYIANDLAEQMASVKVYTDQANPLMAQLLASLPVFLTVIAIGVVLYLGLGQLGDALIRMSEIAHQILLAADKITSCG